MVSTEEPHEQSLMTQQSQATESTSDEITDEEFDQLLAELNKAPDASKQTDLANATYALPPSATIDTVVSVHEQLSDLTKCGGAIQIDASQVEEVDTAMIQCLLAFVKTHDDAANGLAITGASDVFKDTATLLGVHRMFSGPSGSHL